MDKHPYPHLGECTIQEAFHDESRMETLNDDEHQQFIGNFAIM